MKQPLAAWISVGWLVLLIACSGFLPLILPNGPYDPIADPLLPPSSQFLMGTDALGRDFLSRTIYGARRTLSAGALAATITIFTGIMLGLIVSTSKGWVDRVLLGLINATLAIPGLLFALLLTASMGAGFRTVIVAIGFGLIPGYARLVRSVFLQVRNEEFVTAARSVGLTPMRVAVFHILPNAIRGVATFSALHFSWAIMGITTLTFLGLSGDPSIPELGAMLDAGRQYLPTAPHLAIIPGVIISLTILSIYRISEALSA